MSQSAIQSVNLPIEISQDNGVTYKSIICIEGFAVTNTSPTNDADTACGRFVGIGIEGSEIQGTGVVAMFPTASQLSYQDITTFQFNLTQVKYRTQYPSTGSIGGYLYQTGQALFSVTSIQDAAGQVVKFGFTLKGIGSRNIVPGT
jgi:hypothetical protein